MRFFYFIVTIFDFLSSDVGMNKWSNPFSILASIFDKSNLAAILYPSLKDLLASPL